MVTTTRTRSKGTARRKAATRKATTARKATARKSTVRKAGTRKTAARGRRKAGSRRAKTARTLGGPAAAISKADFVHAAKQLHLQIGSGGKGAAEFDLDPREFSSGSFGWFASEKFDVPVGNKKVRCQLSFNVTVIGSKNSR